MIRPCPHAERHDLMSSCPCGFQNTATSTPTATPHEPVNPAAVALADQWQAEIMDVAREMAATQLTKEDIPLDEDEMALLEAGCALGYAASLVVLQRNGWLRKP